MKHLLLLTWVMFSCVLRTFAQSAAKGDIDAFIAKTGSKATIDKATNSLSFLRFPSGRAYQAPGGDVQQKSINFISENSKMFGIRSDQDGHRIRDQRSDNYGLQNVTLQQTYKGVPVYDGLLRFHYNKSQNLTAVNGNFISGIKVSTVPKLAQYEAEALAIKHVTGQHKLNEIPAGLHAQNSTLYIFQKGLVQGYNGPKHLVYEVEVKNDVDIREFLYIDAHTGRLVEQFTGIHAIDRKLYEVNFANLKWKEGDDLPGDLNIWQQSEVESAGFIYNLMKNTFGHASYDGEEASMLTINNNPGINCPNANWNGVTANYCDNLATDDVVAHEWGHAYTEYTSGLIYAWQSGALNEAYSDIWGETVDQIDGYFDEGESMANRTGCGSSAKWQVGEQATAFNGALRDMWDPTCFGNPGKVSDPLYWCSEDDGGGVHSNSGVINHTYALLVDGGTYNGQTIAGIGLTKAAHIFWRAQSVYMTATTDFSAHADMLEAAATDLIGLPLTALSTETALPGTASGTITPDDVAELMKVILATELRSDPDCPFVTLLQPVAGLCEGAKQENAIFFEDFESGLGGFTTSHEAAAGSWLSRNWVTVNAPGNHPGKVAFGIDPDAGDCGNSIQTGIIRMESPLIEIPAGTAGKLSMAFDHYVATEYGWDGGNIKYSINGEEWTILPANAFTANPYNASINGPDINDNPLAGEPAFTGSDGGSLFGSWGQSQIDLTSIGLEAGDEIQFRWEFGTDCLGGNNGWYVDNISVYTCAVTPAVHFAQTSISVNEGEANVNGANCASYIDKAITIQIDKAPSQPVTVTFAPTTGSAKLGETKDYTISPASVTLNSANLTRNVIVRVYNDAYIEGPETVNISYTIDANGGDGYAADSMQTCQLTIVDDDLEPGNYSEVLLNTTFNEGLEGWRIINGGNSEPSWIATSYPNIGLDPAGRPFLFANAETYLQSNIIMDEIAESPAVNTQGKKNLVLTFQQEWRPYVGDFQEQGTVEIWDGSAWHKVLTQNESTPRRGNLNLFTANTQTIPIPDEYANVNMKVRFRYIAGWDYYWAIDNVKITSTNSYGIQSTVNSGNADQQYLGPNETAAFYDPATGDIMAKIKNLSGHDYGCTTVEIDRAGTDETDWVGPYHITNKTFRVTPANNNANGKYEITLYYKNSELPNFRGSDITSMGKSEGNIGDATSLLSSFAEVQATTAFNADLAFTSTFTSGFSGFGLSDAPPVGPLPVTLVNFDGKNTPEGNKLTWTTTSEVSNAYFAVERTQNGRNFKQVGQVTGVGNSSVENHYKFTDSSYPDGISYYRLKQVDHDGTIAYSRIISIDAINTGELKFFPNPVQGLLTMEVPDKELKMADISVIGGNGQELLSRKKVKAASGKLKLDLGKLPSGLYQIKVTSEKGTYTRSVFKY